MNAIIDLHYLPCIAYFSCISRFNTVIIEKHEYYEKQTFRNRCQINTANGVERLTVPLTSKHNKVLITDVRIDHSQKWLNNHWRAIESAYRNAPYFEHYADDLHKILLKKHVHLYELNVELLTICLSWLKFEILIKESVSYEKIPIQATQDMRNKIHAKKMEIDNINFASIRYQQVFGKTFVSNLSIIDLLFCEGPNARKIVWDSTKPEQINLQ